MSIINFAAYRHVCAALCMCVCVGLQGHQETVAQDAFLVKR